MAQQDKKVIFIINPNAGKRQPEAVTALIRTTMPTGAAYDIVAWTDKDHFDAIEERIHHGGYTHAVAVGGDGTVNHVAKTLLNTNITLGILPIGSGNGLARTLGISMNLTEAIGQVATGRSVTIDSGQVNGIPFFCTSGVGFDARIGELFASSVKRGLRSYIQITLGELFRYRAQTYTLRFDGQVLQKKAFLITVANAGQYGNDFYIAPKADMQDGLFHVAVLKPFSALTVGGILSKVLQRRAHLSKHIETFVTSQLIITRDGGGPVHFDGEPVVAGRELVFENRKHSLQVLVGKGFKVS